MDFLAQEAGPRLSTFESIKGLLAVVAGLLVFVGSGYVLLSAIFGRAMGYLVAMTSFFGIMVLMSIIWVIGVPGSTPPSGGPRGREPGWDPVAAGLTVSSPKFSVVDRYPGPPWQEPDPGATADVDAVSTAIQTFLSRRANEEGNLTGAQAIPITEFTVQDVRFAEQDGVRLAAAQAFYNFGGPLVEVFAVYDKGSVPLPGGIFLVVSLIGFAVHLPFLDRAEKKRKEILTGGTAPPFLGPA
jgi:hypothetical protein